MEWLFVEDGRRAKNMPGDRLKDEDSFCASVCLWIFRSLLTSGSTSDSSSSSVAEYDVEDAEDEIEYRFERPWADAVSELEIVKAGGCPDAGVDFRWGEENVLLAADDTDEAESTASHAELQYACL